MKKKIFLVMAFLSLFFLFCCKKREAKPLKKLDETSKNYTKFEVNSTWIYQLKGQTNTDTCKITVVRSGTSLSSKLDYDYEAHETQMTSTYHNKKTWASTEARPDADGVCIHNLWFDGARTSTKCVFFSNRSVGDAYNYWYYPDNIVTYQSYLPTYVLEGKTYNEVMVFESRYTGASVSFDDVRLPIKTWFAKNIGIIRKEMKNGEIWNLISHDVKQ